MTEMKGCFIFASKADDSWLWKATKRERIEMAKQIASTVGTTDEEISYIDTANLQDMHKEERTWLAKKIVSSIPHGRGYTGC
ncbi:MAG: hypothetical protein C3F06_05655 [Candidatus Methanoperedenaceae archaeon]|nr:MAG: hypothetical protein C3F06_05655 [Candidatus Methanoperedenaceae archaeon]